MSQKKYLELTAEDSKKIAKARADEAEAKAIIDDEWLAIAEFGLYYGYEGIRAIFKDEIDKDTLIMLNAAGRRLEAQKLYDEALNIFYAQLSASSSDAIKTFVKLMKPLKDRAGL